MAWRIERIQKRAFRIILPGNDYSVALNFLKMQSPSERRENHCVDLIAHMSATEHRLHNLLQIVSKIKDKGKLDLMLICTIIVNLRLIDLRTVL